MERDQFQLAGDELLDRVAGDQLEPTHEGQSQLEKEPSRPREDNYAQLRQERDGYNRGNMARQQSAAILTNNRINAAYFEHIEQEGQQRQEQRHDVGEARETVEQRVEQSQTRAPGQAAEQSGTTREAQHQHSQEQEPDWEQYAKNPEYRAQVDKREKSQQQTHQEREATVQRDRER